MSKRITLTYTNGPWTGKTFTLDADAFARTAAAANLHEAPSAWLYAGLLAFNATGEVELSPRGEDLLGSIDSIPDDPVTEPAKPLPCSACDGTGEQALFISMHPCDVCGGTGHAKALVVKDARVRVTADDGIVLSCNLSGAATARTSAAVTLGYHVAWTPEHWHTEGLPEVGRFAEVEVATGERLRGQVSKVSDSYAAILLSGPASVPCDHRLYTYGQWYVWPKGGDDERYVRWRYINGPV